MAAAACSSNVDLPIPGSPPMSTSEPGTMPPPRTRSNSSMLVERRGWSVRVTSAYFRAVLRVLVLFALVTPFWSLFDQKASTWVLQADQMAKPEWFQSSMMQALNPALVMILIPFNNLVLYPLLQRMGLRVKIGRAHV